MSIITLFILTYNSIVPLRLMLEWQLSILKYFYEERMMQRLKYFYKRHALTVTLLFFGLLSIAMVAIVYLQPNKILSGSDYHRIENLALSIKQGEWFPRISYFFIGGMGYAAGLFLSRCFSLLTSYSESSRTINQREFYCICNCD